MIDVTIKIYTNFDHSSKMVYSTSCFVKKCNTISFSERKGTFSLLLVKDHLNVHNQLFEIEFLYFLFHVHVPKYI